MEYDLNQLADGKRLQRLVNAILIARFGEGARLTPLGGADDGSDGGAIIVDLEQDAIGVSTQRYRFHHPLFEPPRAGRYLFQVKFHKTGEQRLSDLRTTVVREFRKALQTDLLDRADRHDVDFFFLVTNVSASKESLRRLSHARRYRLGSRRSLQADIWWRESIIAFLDWSPQLWAAFPEVFPGATPPLLAQAFAEPKDGKPKAIRLAIAQQHGKDEAIRFQQIELEQKLADLFVDLDLDLEALSRSMRRFRVTFGGSRQPVLLANLPPTVPGMGRRFDERPPRSALELLIDDRVAIPRILLEGGPGQGKSTITQMVAQIYRGKLLGISQLTAREAEWSQRCRVRIPFRIELRNLSQWLSQNPDGTIDQYLAEVVGRDSGGTTITVEDIHAAVERSSVILILDGLDEIGNDTVRDIVLDRIVETANRFDDGLNADLRVILTTRPPAVSGRRNKLEGFTRLVLAPMNASRIDDYVARWLKVQHLTEEQLRRIPNSFNSRRHDPHVDALARNPMQLSVLLQFIARRGEAFPDRRADLYREYFQVVIDRDVEKSPELAEIRDMMESLHSFLGFRLHGAAEVEGGRRSFGREEVVKLAVRWLEQEGHSTTAASEYFALGEERFGLIVALLGEGTETRYGFEVQPIQEYFAASYISNRLQTADANDVFEWLIQRPYWREVALFLGGLRRSNEKADLVARARQADTRPLRPWDQSGHGIILALLQEAVLSQPRHVLVEAMRFVLELAESRALRLHPEPDALVRDLGHLVTQHKNIDVSDQLVGIAKATVNSDDEHLIYHAYRLAANTLPPVEFASLASDFTSTRSADLSMVRVTCAYHSPDALRRLGQDPRYWDDIPLPMLSAQLWRAALQHKLLVEACYPAELHIFLLTQFAAAQAIEQDGNARILNIEGTCVPAVWKLQQNLDAMRLSIAHRSAPDRDAIVGEVVDWASLRYTGELDYSGIGSSEACVRDLVETSDDLLTSLMNDGDALLSERLAAYLIAIHKHFSGPGLAGWVACRCGTELLQGWESIGRDVREGLFKNIVRGLSEYFGLDDVSVSTRRFAFEQGFLNTPEALRVESGGELAPVWRVMDDFLTGSIDPEARNRLEWILHSPLPADAIRSLVDKHRADLASLLRFLGTRTVVGRPWGRRLRIQDTHRILGICRKSDDADILRGAATVLLNATFARIAEAELVVKILAVAPSSQLVERVMDTAEVLHGVDAKARRADEDLARRVSWLILDYPERYPFRIVNFASSFLSRTAASPSLPLFEDHPKLVNALT